MRKGELSPFWDGPLDEIAAYGNSVRQRSPVSYLSSATEAWVSGTILPQRPQVTLLLGMLGVVSGACGGTGCGVAVSNRNLTARAGVT